MEWKHKFSVMLYSLIAITFFGPSFTVSRASYGEECNRENRCESRSFLACINNGTCDCLMPDSMVYDPESSTCVTLAGERCQFSTVEGDRTWTDEVTFCVSSAKCTDGICECLPSHYEVSNGTCVPKGGIGATCTVDTMCNSKHHIVCGEGKSCICKAGRVYLEDTGGCAILVGERCNARTDSLCVPGAFCSLNNRTSERCKCSGAYFEKDGMCKKKGFKGASCESDTECVNAIAPNVPSLLVCSDGKCQCDKLTALDDDSVPGRQCVKQLGRLCVSGECLKGAVCRNSSCICSHNHFQTENQTCDPRKLLGSGCNRGDQCISGLWCLDGKCTCPSGQSFDYLKASCALSVGSECRRYDTKLACVPNAYCYTRDSYYDTSGICSCDSNFHSSISGDGYCYLNEGVPGCTGDSNGKFSSVQCRPGLVCRDNVCKCLNRALTYNYTIEKCQSYLGGPCSSTDECVGNLSECSEENGAFLCQCKKGFVQVDQNCQIAFGSKCNFTLRETGCDKVAGLECSSKEVCECPGGQIYDPKALNCKGLVGTKCGSGITEARNCTVGASCEPVRGLQNTLRVCTCSEGFQVGPGRKCYAIAENLVTNDVKIKHENSDL